MMRCFLTLIFILVLTRAGVADEHEPALAELESLTAQIAAAETAAEDNVHNDTALVRLRTELDTISKSVIAFAVSLRPRLNEINGRLDELGPGPRPGEPAEPEILTAERNALLAEKARLNGLLVEAESLSIRANKAVDRTITLRRELFASALFKRTEVAGAISADTWQALKGEVGAAWNQLSSRLRFQFSFRRAELLQAVGWSLLIGLSTYFAVRRFLGVMVGLNDTGSDQSYIAKLSLAFWMTVIPSLAMAASLAAVFALFVHFGVFAQQSRLIIEALLVSVAAIFFIQRLANALFSPRDPSRRLIQVTDSAAGVLVAAVVGLAIVHVLDYFFGRLNVIFSAPLSLTVAKSLVSSLAISFILILIAFVKPFRDVSSGRTRGWARWVRIPLVLAALFIIAMAVTGFIGLARFAAAQIVVTGAILATMYIGVQSGHVLAAEGVFPNSAVGQRVKQLFSLSDTALDQLGLLLSFVIYGTVVAIGLPLILLQWGFNQVDIQIWLYRILTDIRIGTISISLIGILFGLIVFVAGFLLTRRFQRWLDGSVMARGRFDPGVRNSVRTMVGYAGVGLAALIGLSAAGFDLTNLALVAGALSLGIGFGLQNVVNNFVSGLILLAERPFKVGDWIVAGNNAGFVRKISVRATEIETFQHQTVILPNSELINGAVGNWMHRNHRGRIEIPVAAAYGVKPRMVHDLLLEVAGNDPDVLSNPGPSVVFLGFGESSLDFELRVHVPEVLDSLSIATRLRFGIVDAFEASGIQIPYPHREVSLKLADLEALLEAIKSTKPGKRAG